MRAALLGGHIQVILLGGRRKINNRHRNDPPLPYSMRKGTFCQCVRLKKQEVYSNEKEIFLPCCNSVFYPAAFRLRTGGQQRDEGAGSQQNGTTHGKLLWGGDRRCSVRIQVVLRERHLHQRQQ